LANTGESFIVTTLPPLRRSMRHTLHYVRNMNRERLAAGLESYDDTITTESSDTSAQGIEDAGAVRSLLETACASEIDGDK